MFAHPGRLRGGRERVSVSPVPRSALSGLLGAALAPLAAFTLATSSATGAPVEALVTQPTRPSESLAPGVVYQRLVRSGGQVVHVVRARRDPLIGLTPVLAGGAPTARGQLTDTLSTRRVSAGAVAGINGDFFNYTTANPSGIVLIDSQLIKDPEASRSALLIRADGFLDSGVLELRGIWQASDPRAPRRFATRTFQGVNRSAFREAEAIVYTPAYGRVQTPVGASRWEVRIRADENAALTPGVPLSGTVIDEGSGGGMTIGAGHIVLTGIGSSGRTVARDLTLGMRVTLTPQLVSQSDQAALDPQVVSAVGGGPLLVRDGQPVPGREGFSPAQTDSRTARAAVGQTASGITLLVVAEGPVQGSPGVTVAEQARLLADLGARVAVAMDAGGSAQMAIGPRSLLYEGGTPRSLSTVLNVDYRGLLLDGLPARLSPNADRVDDSAALSLSAASGGRVSVDITDRNGARRRGLWAGELAGTAARVLIDPHRLRLPDGIYLVNGRMTPVDGGREQTVSRRVVVDRTLGSLAARASGRRARARLDVSFRLSRPARVSVRVRDISGRAVAVLARNRPMRAGAARLSWNRRYRGRIATGTHRVEVVAQSALGRSGLVRRVPFGN